MSLLSNFRNSKQVLNSYNTGENVEITGELREQLQKTLLKMVSDILEACSSSGIDMFLSGGSALGAIRHQGIIPWDDDIDLGITRSDFERFIPVFEEKLSEKYILNSPNYSKDVITRFPKILLKNSLMITSDTDIPELQKVYIDIFILDNIPDNAVVRMLKGAYCNALMFITNQVALVTSGDDFVKSALRNSSMIAFYIRIMIGKLFSFRSVSRWNDAIDKAIRYKHESPYVGFTTGRKHYFGEILEKERLFPLKAVRFGEYSAKVFGDADYYLKNLYGDYRIIPPVEKRERHFVKKLEIYKNEVY